MNYEPHTRHEPQSKPNQIFGRLIYSPNSFALGLLTRATMTISAPRNNARRMIPSMRRASGTVDAVVLALCGSSCGGSALIASTYPGFAFSVYGYHQDCSPMHGCEQTREAAMAAFAKSRRRE